MLLEGRGLFDERLPPLETPWTEVPLAFLDVETTGLHPEGGDRVIEVAIERHEPDREGRRFVEIFDPGRAIPEETRPIHEIHPHQTRRCRPFSAAAPGVIEMLEGAVRVGHNVSFDLRFIRRELELGGRAMPPGWTIDTLLLARRWCRIEGYSLGAVASHLGLGRRRLHQALDDILTTEAVLSSLIARIGPPPRTLRDVLAAMLPAKDGE